MRHAHRHVNGAIGYIDIEVAAAAMLQRTTLCAVAPVAGALPRVYAAAAAAMPLHAAADAIDIDAIDYALIISLMMPLSDFHMLITPLPLPPL